MKRVGRRYRPQRVDEHYDVIVIGSGIGGLANAALLSRLGRRVCVLEQHYTAGGFTHTYERNGYEWDVGVHYIGEVHKPYSPLRRIFDVISDGQLQWAQMDDTYDRIIIGGESVDVRVGSDQLAEDRKARFPEEADAIARYGDLVVRVGGSMRNCCTGQALWTGMNWRYRLIRDQRVPKECTMTVREVLESLTQNQQLIGVLTGQWGDYGMPPAEATFLMHASVAKHYFSGGCYPVGGSWKIADTIVPVIRASGGEVFTYAEVAEILVEKGAATGVRMADGHVIHAGRVVSSAGARNTFEKLLPEAERGRLGVSDKMQSVRPSASHICLYAGFKGTAEELGLPRTNLWVYPSAEHEQNLARFEADQNQPLPLVYISFPSAKDPDWINHYPDKSTVEVISLGPYAWFEQWRETTWNQRGDDYDSFKTQLSDRLLEALFEQMPQLRDALDYFELSTPLSTEWFNFYDQGEIYGLDHDPERFRQRWLHPVTPVKNLYLTGQDVVTAGVGGALMGGVLTTGAMLGLQQRKLWQLLKDWQPPAGDDPHRLQSKPA